MSKSAFRILLFLCVFALLLSLWWFIRPDDIQPQPSPAAYILKDCGGRLALYASGSTEPLEVYDIYTNLLPQTDVLALKNGVPVSDDTQLNTLLEDYGL